ncbi:hypothetical protein D1AOALGA4SA_8872 [Olavius algarvensis Delta 1 endosymbiont]|nr:hypothetical protein D1AOALGA4SA_8872 [Olavius algarvensis Delta 1 endosymbiont]
MAGGLPSAGHYVSNFKNLKANRRISNKKFRMMKCGIAALCLF